MSVTMLGQIRRMVTLTVDGTEVRVPEGATILDALHSEGTPEQADTPTLCWAPNMNPINACRVCVVEVENSRVLVPSCARKAEDGMVVRTDSEKVRHSRRMVLELLASSADMSQASADVQRWMADYGVDAERYGPARPARRRRGARPPPRRPPPRPRRDHRGDRRAAREDRQRPLRARLRALHPLLQVRQGVRHRRAVHVRDRRGRARVRRPDRHRVERRAARSACVYCGNCIGVCPTGALKSVREHELREAGDWQPEEETVTTTICSFCGVGCNLELHVQQGQIVNVTSPSDHSVTHGHLCDQGPVRLPARPEPPGRLNTVNASAGRASPQR
jgi:predicted molibdopterin-dependent oxidoreductase YjgC